MKLQPDMKRNNRYRNNKTLLPNFENFIFSQADSPVSDLKYGRANCGIKKNGCGAVAVYNAMKLTGQPVDFCELLRELEALKMPWLFGLFGTTPLSLGRFFRKHRAVFRKHLSLRRFQTSLRDGRCGIVCAWNKGFRGIHFYCVFYDGGNLKAMNFQYADHAVDFSFKELSVLRFIAGYVLF